MTYASKNAKEAFAETFAVIYSGESPRLAHETPKSIEYMMNLIESGK